MGSLFGRGFDSRQLHEVAKQRKAIENREEQHRHFPHLHSYTFTLFHLTYNLLLNFALCSVPRPQLSRAPCGQYIHTSQPKYLSRNKVHQTNWGYLYNSGSCIVCKMYYIRILRLTIIL